MTRQEKQGICLAHRYRTSGSVWIKEERLIVTIVDGLLEENFRSGKNRRNCYNRTNYTKFNNRELLREKYIKKFPK